MRTGSINGGLTKAAVTSATNGCICDGYSIPCAVLDGSNHPACETTTIIPGDLKRNNRGIPADTRDANCVVSLCGDNARDMGTVSMTIRRVVISIATQCAWAGVRKVPAIRVIDIAICIIVNAIPGDLARVCPDVVSKLGMRFVDTGIEDCNSQAVRPFMQTPRPGGIDGI